MLRYLLCLFFLFGLSGDYLSAQRIPAAQGAAPLSKKVERTAKKMAKINVYMRMNRDILDIKSFSSIDALDPLALARGEIRRNGVNDFQRNGFYRRLDRFEFDRYSPNISYNDYIFLSSRRVSQYDLLRSLDKHASEGELIKLTGHENPVVRAYSFFLLLSNHYPGSFAMLKNHLEDEQIIRVFGDYDATDMKVGDHMVQMMTPGMHDDFLLKMTAEQRQELNELLIDNPDIILEEKNNVMGNLPSTAQNYDKIKATAYKKRDSDMVVKLAEFQREEDLEFFHSFLNTKGGQITGFQVIRKFPHDSFFEALKRAHSLELPLKKPSYGYLTFLYQAIAQYPGDEARAMMMAGLENSHKKAKRKHRENIWLALFKFPDASLNDIKAKTKLDRYDQRRLMKMRNF